MSYQDDIICEMSDCVSKAVFGREFQTSVLDFKKKSYSVRKITIKETVQWLLSLFPTSMTQAKQYFEAEGNTVNNI